MMRLSFVSALLMCATAATAQELPNACQGLDAAWEAPGTLTVATEQPVYPPWFIGNNLTSGEGYEGSMVYEIAKRLGLKADQVKWVVTPYPTSYAPGAKAWDFFVGQISITEERAKNVTFSFGYFEAYPAIVVLNGTPASEVKTVADVQPLQLGAVIGNTQVEFIASQVKPAQQTKIFNSLNDAAAALIAGQIDGFVTDVTIAAYMSALQIPNSTVVGRFASGGAEFGLVFEGGSPLAPCIDAVLDGMKQDGTLNAAAAKWLNDYNQIPVIE